MKKFSLNSGYIGIDQTQGTKGTAGIVKNFILRKAAKITLSLGLIGNVVYDPKQSSSYPGSGPTMTSLGDLDYDATLVNGVSVDANGAFDLDGTGAYMTADQGAELFNATTVTLEMVINPTVDSYTSGAGGRVIWSTHTASYTNRYIFVIAPDTGQIGRLGSPAVTLNDSEGTVGGEWKVVHFTKDGTTWDIYINGIKKGTTTVTNHTDNGTLSFGQEWDSSNSSDHFLGGMGSIHIFSRKLNPSEIANRASTALQSYN